MVFLEDRPQRSFNWGYLVIFQMLTALTPSEYQYTSARMECNLSKNRNQELLPIESSRIPLAPKPGVEGSDYINASWFVNFYIIERLKAQLKRNQIIFTGFMDIRSSKSSF